MTNRIMSFIGLGIFIVLFICAFVFISYLLIIGAVIGLIIFLIAFIRQKFFSHKKDSVIVEDHEQHRIIDQNDDK